MVSNDMRGLDEDTINSYLIALKRIFVVEDLDAWCPSLRAKGSIRTTATRYFVDPSIAAAALGAGPGDLMNDLRTFGFFFEALAIRDLRVYMDSMRGRVEKYHDKTGLECDAVLHLPNGKYALVEIKLGGETLIAEGIDALGKLDMLIKGKGLPPPMFKMVLTATGKHAYSERDTVICPIGALKP
jgi:predicted AAA+ superfamily ATPase